MSDTPLWQLSAQDVARLTTKGEVSCVEVTRSVIERMHAVNPQLNAVVTELSDAAMYRAQALDASPDPKGPLYGVPITIKVNIDQEGQATTNGLPALANNIAADNAPLVQNLLNAGAVVVGRTNTPEFSLRVHTDNPLHGETKNPWGDHLSPGGSSGGAGAAVAAGIGALGHGNDIAGSLRYPAAAHGLYTVKPGLGRVPAWNPSQTAERGLLAQLMSVQGLITRHAADLHIGMPPMIAPDVRDPYHVPLPWRGELTGDRPKVGVSFDMLDSPLHPEVRAAMEAAIVALSDAGYAIEEIEVPFLRDMRDTAFSALLTEIEMMMGPDIDRLGSDDARAVIGAYYDSVEILPENAYLQALAKRTFFAREMARLLEKTPLLLCPFLPRPFFAPGHDTIGEQGVRECMFDATWCTVMNFVGLPAGNMPTRVAKLGGKLSPVSVQLIGQRWREDLIVDAMTAVEGALPAPIPALWDQMARRPQP